MPLTQRPFGLTALSLFFALATIPSTATALALAFPGAWSEAMWRLKPDAWKGFASLGTWAILLMVVVAASAGCRRTPRAHEKSVAVSQPYCS
jgi:hypothetical protein